MATAPSEADFTFRPPVTLPFTSARPSLLTTLTAMPAPTLVFTLVLSDWPGVNSPTKVSLHFFPVWNTVGTVKAYSVSL